MPSRASPTTWVALLLTSPTERTYEVTELAPTDKAVGYPWYGSKMKHAIAAITCEERPQESGTIAWY